jgi:hypothetical protein
MRADSSGSSSDICRADAALFRPALVFSGGDEPGSSGAVCCGCIVPISNVIGFTHALISSCRQLVRGVDEFMIYGSEPSENSWPLIAPPISTTHPERLVLVHPSQVSIPPLLNK